jgi:hypothetical protein
MGRIVLHRHRTHDAPISLEWPAQTRDQLWPRSPAQPDPATGRGQRDQRGEGAPDPGLDLAALPPAVRQSVEAILRQAAKDFPDDRAMTVWRSPGTERMAERGPQGVENESEPSEAELRTSIAQLGRRKSAAAKSAECATACRKVLRSKSCYGATSSIGASTAT